MHATRLMLLSKPQRPPAAILDQFRAGEKGGIWLPHFQKTLFQDAAMSLPASVGGPVVKMLDLSGNGNTVTFSGVTLQRDSSGLLYLAADGSTSYGSTAAIDFTGTDKMTLCAGLRKESDAAFSCFVELSAVYSNPGSFVIGAPLSTAPNIGVGLCGTQISSYTMVSTAPATLVVSAHLDIAGAARATEIMPRLNGVIPSLTGGGGADAGTGNFGNAALFFFKRNQATSPFTGRFYGLIARGAAPTAGQTAVNDRYMARLSGVSF